MHHHFDPALKGTVYRNIGHEVLFLCAGQILLISHGEENHLMPSCLQRLGQREVIGLRAALMIVEFVNQQDLHSEPHLDITAAFSPPPRSIRTYRR